jgi:segregation and condensation protein A
MKPDHMPPDNATDAAGTGAGPREGKPAPQSTTDEGYRVNLPMFEGPLDLLLHLVKKHELDVLNIPIAFITEKYTAYIQLLDELNIDVASEYLVMAATLVHIKSRMLLPNPPSEDLEDGLGEEELDPRAELVRRLLEYQKYKLAAEELGARNLLGRDVFPRGSSDEIAGGEPPLESVSMFKLLDAFQGVLERTQKTKDHEISFERFSISEKIGELSELLNLRKQVIFHELFEEGSGRAELIMTFLALLEMTRLRMIRLRQDGPLEPIYIELRVADDEQPDGLAGNDAAGDEDEPADADAAVSDDSLAPRGALVDDDSVAEDDTFAERDLFAEDNPGAEDDAPAAPELDADEAGDSPDEEADDRRASEDYQEYE